MEIHLNPQHISMSRKHQESYGYSKHLKLIKKLGRDKIWRTPQPKQSESTGNNSTFKVILIVKYHTGLADNSSSAPADN